MVEAIGYVAALCSTGTIPLWQIEFTAAPCGTVWGQDRIAIGATV